MAGRILKPLSLVGILDETFDLYKSNFLLFMGIAALIQLPVNLAAYFMGGGYVGVVLPLATLPMTFITLAAATLAVSQIYLGSEVTILGAYRSVVRQAYSFIATMFVTSLIIGCGFLLCGVPGVVFSVWYAFVSEVFIVEGLAWGDARKRSKELAVREWKRIILLSAFAGILSFVLQLGLTSLVALATGMDSGDRSGGLSGTLFGLGTGLAETLTSPIGVIAFVLLYYDIRVRREGFDLQMLAKNVADSGIGPKAVVETGPAT